MTKILIVQLMALLFCSCGKSGGTTSNKVENLNVQYTVNTDNSGNVSFTATAQNATTYDFDFGDGNYQQSNTGSITYKYSQSGTYTVNVIAKNGSGGSLSKSVQVVVTVIISVVWSDEFNYQGAPDGSKWGYDIGTGSGGWGNNELEYYTDRRDNSIVSNGTLKIIAKKESYQGSAYTSARLLTKDKFSFKYGKIEARAKLPSGAGTWPAIWMLGNNISSAGWPNCGEIDIMEHKGNDLNKIYGTLHYPGHSGGNANGTTKIIQNATTDFHIYTLEWSSSKIKISVDGEVYFSFDNTSSVPFNQNFFIICNLAMGGNFGGSIDPNFTSDTLEIDYIRVYQ